MNTEITVTNENNIRNLCLIPAVSKSCLDAVEICILSMCENLYFESGTIIQPDHMSIFLSLDSQTTYQSIIPENMENVHGTAIVEIILESEIDIRLILDCRSIPCYYFVMSCPPYYFLSFCTGRWKD